MTTRTAEILEEIKQIQSARCANYGGDGEPKDSAEEIGAVARIVELRAELEAENANEQSP